MTAVHSVCVGCVYAEWRKTSNGRLHPDGSGNCTYQLPDSPLPKWLIGSYGIRYGAITVREALEGSRFIDRKSYRGEIQCGCRKAEGE